MYIKFYYTGGNGTRTKIIIKDDNQTQLSSFYINKGSNTDGIQLPVDSTHFEVSFPELGDLSIDEFIVTDAESVLTGAGMYMITPADIIENSIIEIRFKLTD